MLVGLGLELDTVPNTTAHSVTSDSKADSSDAEPTPTKAYRLPWAKLLARVFQEQVLVCPSCRGPRTIIAAITDLDVAQAILEHLGLPTEQHVLHTARAPPQLELEESFD